MLLSITFIIASIESAVNGTHDRFSVNESLIG